jgi:hypothetical protein
MSTEVNFRTQYDFWKLKSYADAQALAEQASKDHPDMVIVPYDYGYGVSPQFGIIRAPALGDDVSEAINGDYYPLGKVEQIGKDYKRIKAGGKWWYRRKLTPGWHSGCMGLVRGTYDERNPHV